LKIYYNNETEAIFEISLNETIMRIGHDIQISSDNINQIDKFLNDLGEICPDRIKIHNHKNILLHQDVAGLALWAFILLIVFPIFFLTFCAIVLCKWCCPTVCYERHYHHPVPLLVDRGNNFNM
jgi:hypothetical protein